MTDKITPEQYIVWLKELLDQDDLCDQIDTHTSGDLGSLTIIESLIDYIKSTMQERDALAAQLDDALGVIAHNEDLFDRKLKTARNDALEDAVWEADAFSHRDLRPGEDIQSGIVRTIRAMKTKGE